MEKHLIFFVKAVLALFALTVVAIPTYCIWRAIQADGRVDYCYVRAYSFSGTTIHTLYGRREWREDRIIAEGLRSTEEAKQKADAIGCPIQ